MNNFVILLLVVPILALALLLLNLVLAVHKPYAEKVSIYECGFETIPEQTRSQFQISFFLVALLFLIFDLEIVLCFPAAVSLYQISFYGFSIFLIFLLVLIFGFVLEIASSAIQIASNSSTYKE